MNARGKPQKVTLARLDARVRRMTLQFEKLYESLGLLDRKISSFRGIMYGRSAAIGNISVHLSQLDEARDKLQSEIKIVAHNEQVLEKYMVQLLNGKHGNEEQV